MKPLAAASWDDLLAVDLQRLPRNVVGQARPVVNSPWLRDVDIELVDTPGSAGLDDQHMLTLEALAHCDAALLTIAAIDRTQFLEEDILRRGGVPRLAWAEYCGSRVF